MPPKKGQFRIEIDKDVVIALAKAYTPIAEIAKLVGVAPRTLEARCKEEIELGHAQCKSNVRQGILALAFDDKNVDVKTRATLLIYLSKAMLGWRDSGPEPGESQKIDATCTVAFTSTDGRVTIVKPGSAEVDEHSTSHT